VDPTLSSSPQARAPSIVAKLEHVVVREPRCEGLVRRRREGADALGGERRAHLCEHLAGHTRDDVDTKRWAHATLEQPAGSSDSRAP